MYVTSPEFPVVLSILKFVTNIENNFQATGLGMILLNWVVISHASLSTHLNGIIISGCNNRETRIV